MIEVFKTNVQNQRQAMMLLDQIRQLNEAYRANFDLDDCDRILRVDSLGQPLQPTRLVELLMAFGYEACVLPDEPVAARLIR